MTNKKPLHLILSCVFMTIGVAALGISSAIACVKCADDCDPGLMPQEQDRVDQLAQVLAQPGSQQVITEIVYDSINHHLEHGDSADTAISHIEQTVADHGL